MWDPIVNSTSLNGNTSIIVGQCGAVIAPVRPGDGDWYLRMFNFMEGVPLASQRAGSTSPGRPFRNTWMPSSAGAASTWGVCGALGRQTLCHGRGGRGARGDSGRDRGYEAPGARGHARWRPRLQRGQFVGQGEGLFGVKVPSSVATDDERYALGSVLGELGTGVFQVSGGAPGGFRGPAMIAQELSRRTGRPAIYNLLAQEINKPDEWKEHLHMLETAFKAGIRAYGSCLSATAGPIFDLRAGLDGLEDEDMISPTTVFQGMPTWDTVMAQPLAQRMQSFRDLAIRKQLSVEAVETAGAHAYRMGLAQRNMALAGAGIWWKSI